MSYNWQNYNKKLKYSDAKNTRNIDAFLSNQKWSETVFPVKFQLKGFVPPTTEKWRYKEKNRGTK